MEYAETVISVLEIRELFGSVNLKEYVEQFGIMKDMDVSWVEELESYVRNGGTFEKAVNPHECKLGIWYDSFHSENKRLNRILKKINPPHERIHQCGAEIVKLRSMGANMIKKLKNCC